MVRLRPINLCFIFKVIAPVELAAAQRELFFVACVSFIYLWKAARATRTAPPRCWHNYFCATPSTS